MSTASVRNALVERLNLEDLQKAYDLGVEYAEDIGVWCDETNRYLHGEHRNPYDPKKLPLLHQAYMWGVAYVRIVDRLSC